MIRRQVIPQPRSLSLACSKGFTLIELSVVVVIMVMLMSLGLGVLNAQLASAAQTETKKRQAIIQEALTAYLGANKRLPCPDVPNNTNGAANTTQITGAEDRAGGLPTGACSANIGVVPYATLGLGRELALDGWGNFMSYSIRSSSSPCMGTVPDWTLSACFGAAKGSPYSLFEGTVAAPTLAASNVLAVVTSHGPNGFAAWGRQGSRNVLPLGCEEAHNAMAAVSGCTLTPDRFYKGERPEVDDVVAALTRDEVINALVRQGALKSSEGQLVEDLAKLRNDRLYQKASTDDCGLPVDPATERDPWGNLYGVVAGAASNGLPICICSTRGSGSLPAPPGSTCTPAAPTTCIQINESEVNLLRVQMGKPIC